MPPTKALGGVYGQNQKEKVKYDDLSPYASQCEHDKKTMNILNDIIADGKIYQKDVYTEEYPFWSIWGENSNYRNIVQGLDMGLPSIDTRALLFDQTACKIASEIVKRDGHIRNTFLFIENGKNNKVEIMARIPSPSNLKAATAPLRIDMFVRAVTSFNKHQALSSRMKDVRMMKENERLEKEKNAAKEISSIRDQSRRINRQGKFKQMERKICGKLVGITYLEGHKKKAIKNAKKQLIKKQGLDLDASYSQDDLSSDEEFIPY